MITVRSIEPADHEIWRRLFTEYGVFYETTFDEPTLTGVWDWLMQPTHPVAGLVAVDAGGAVVGFAHLREVPDTFTAAPSYFLDDLYVSPEARGEGAATALIEECFARGGGAQLRWITAESNATARRLYDRVATRATWVTYEKDS